MTRKNFIFQNCLKLVITFPRNHLKSFLGYWRLMNCSTPANVSFHLIMQIRLTLDSAPLLKAEFLRVGTWLKPFKVVNHFLVADTRLYKPLYSWSVGPLVRRSVTKSLFEVFRSIHPSINAAVYRALFIKESVRPWLAGLAEGEATLTDES